MLFKTQPKSLVQIFREFMTNSKVTAKSTKVADDTCQVNGP